MTTTQSSTVALYAELNKAIHIADYRQALKAANKSKFVMWQQGIIDILY